MVQAEELRQGFAERLKKALAHRGIPEWGAGARLAKITGKTAKAASKWLNGEAMPGRANMRVIADYCGVRIEWLQHDEGDMLAGPSHPVVQGGKAVRSPKTNLIGSMGEGTDIIDGEAIDWVTLSLDWATAKHVYVTRPENLALIEGRGNSMEGIFNHGDILIVDRGVKEVKIDAVYAFRFEDKIWIKTLQRMPGNALKAISNNKTYEPFTIDEENGASFEVLGKVVWVWNGKAL